LRTNRNQGFWAFQISAQTMQRLGKLNRKTKKQKTYFGKLRSICAKSLYSGFSGQGKTKRQNLFTKVPPSFCSLVILFLRNEILFKFLCSNLFTIERPSIFFSTFEKQKYFLEQNKILCSNLFSIESS